MRTKIQCSWLVGYVGNGHVLWRDAELVYEGTQIVFVGERFEQWLGKPRSVEAVSGSGPCPAGT
jgi:hypothetical protein